MDNFYEEPIAQNLDLKSNGQHHILDVPTPYWSG